MRYELGHRRQADRRQAEFTEGVEQVGEHQPVRGGRQTVGDDAGGEEHHEEADRHADETEGELDRRGGIEVAPCEVDPDRREHRREDDDEDRVERLEPTCREGERTDHAVGVAFGEQVQRGAGLLEARPEERAGDEQHDQRQHALALDAVETGEEQQIGEVERGHADDHEDAVGLQFDR